MQDNYTQSLRQSLQEAQVCQDGKVQTKSTKQAKGRPVAKEGHRKIGLCKLKIAAAVSRDTTENQLAEISSSTVSTSNF